MGRHVPIIVSATGSMGMFYPVHTAVLHKKKKKKLLHMTAYAHDDMCTLQCAHRVAHKPDQATYDVESFVPDSMPRARGL